MKSESILFSVLITVLLKYSTATSLRKEYIGSCIYYEVQVSNTINDIVELACYDTDAQTNKVFPQKASVYLECANKRKAFGYEAGNIIVKGCQMSRIKYNISTVFKNFHTLNVSGIELQSLPSSFFTGAKFLKTLIASKNRLLEIPSFQFAQCPALTDVDYSHNKISSIDSEAFGGVSSVMKTLNLSHNHLTVLPRNCFANLSKLEVLDLSYNGIEHLVPLVNLSKLVNLNLSFNKIKDLPDAMILSQPDLRFLQLSHNNLTILKMETFAKQRNLQLLDLSYNSIKRVDFNVTRMEHLEKFHIHNNQLYDLDGFKNLLFPILNSFAIDGNKFNCSYLTTFVNLFDYHSSLSMLHITNSTGIKDIEGKAHQVHGIECYNITYPSTVRVLEESSTVSFSTSSVIKNTPTITDISNHTSKKGAYSTITTQHNAQSDENTTTTTASLHQTLLTDASTTSTSSHPITHLLIVMYVLVALNVGVMIIMIIRQRKSTSLTSTIGYNCAYNADIGPRLSNVVVENQYETVLIGGKRCNDSDLI